VLTFPGTVAHRDPHNDDGHRQLVGVVTGVRRTEIDIDGWTIRAVPPLESGRLLYPGLSLRP
jgi:hypothetical protein